MVLCELLALIGENDIFATTEYTISDEAAFALREEFAAEDLTWAEAGMTDRLAHLQQEDVT